MANNDITPFDGQLDETKPANLNPFDGSLDGEEPSRGFKGWAKDIGATALKGAIGVPEAIVGLADIPTGGRVGKFLENEGGAVGFRPKQAKEVASDFNSDATKLAQKKFQEAEGIGGKLQAAIENPSIIATSIGESLPAMGAGGVAARGLLAATRLGAMGAKGAAIAGAAGEGALMAGSAAETIRQETADGLLTPEQSALAGATGLVGGAFGAASGRMANKLGIGDVDTMIAQGAKGLDVPAAAVNPLVQQQAVKSIPKQIIQGAISEGFLEELPQSVAEQVLQNLALGKDWHQDVDAAIVLGTLSGSVMGGGAAGFSGAMNRHAPEQPAPASPGTERVRQAYEQNLLALPAPTINVGPGGEAETAVDRNARLRRIQDGDIVDVTPIVKRSEQMGLNPAAGAMSAAAAVAVDTGAADQVQQQAALESAAEADANTSGVPVVDYADLSDDDRAAVDDYYRRADEETRNFISMGMEDDDGLPDFDTPGDPSTENFLRALGASEQEIQDAISTTSAPAGPLQSAAGNGPAAPNDAGSAQQGAGATQTQAQGQTQGLTTTGEPTNGTQAPQAVEAAPQGREAQPEPANLKAPRGILAKKAEADAARATSTANGQATQPTEATADAGTAVAPAAGRAGVSGVDEQGAVSALSNVQDAPKQPAGTEAQAAPSEARAPEGGNVAAAGGVPAATGAGDVQADGVNLSKNPPELNTSAEPAQETPKTAQVEQKPRGVLAKMADQKRAAAIDRIAKGTAYFGTKDKAAEFIEKSGIGDTHEVVQAKPGRFEIREKVVAQKEPTKPVVAQKPVSVKDKAAALADYFTPGNIVKSYGGHDEVLSYLPADENGAWSVTVHAIGRRDGKWVRLGKPQDARTHSTMPDGAALAAGPVVRLPYQAAGEVVYTEPRADGKPFPNAVDRGVKPAAASQPKPEKQPEASAAAAPASQQETAKAPAEPAAPTPQPVKPEPSSNTIFTEDAAAAARARLKAKLGRLNSGIDPEMMMDGITLAGYHIEKGARTFAAYAKAMVSDLGDGVKPYLKSWYMGVKYDPRGGTFDGMDSATVVESTDVDAMAKDEPTAKTLIESLYQAIRANEMPKDNPALKKLVEAFDGKPSDQERMKQAQESLETAIVMVARDMVAKKEGDRTTFDILLRLYERQPNLNIRTSTSIANQAYSTPAPLAYLASRLAGITKGTVAHEPTGGTGMLLIGADPDKAIVNELNDLRIEALKSQGFKPTQKDAATQMLVPEGTQPDAVVTNPPFGSIKDAEGKPVKVKVDGFSLGQIDHLISARALGTMKEDGRATLILGANKVAGGLSTDDRIFFNWLYSHYNVVGHFEVEGDLYNRQGAGWPVRVITINGRQKSDKFSPVAGTIQRVDNWDSVYEQFTQSLNSAQAPRSRATPSADSAGGRVAAAVATPSQAGGGRPAGGARGAGDVAGTGARAVPDRSKPAAGPVAAVPDEQRLNAQPYVPQPQPGQEPSGADRPAKPAGTAPVEEANGNEFQLPYTPRSSRKDEGVLIPANMAQPTQDALSSLEDEVGDIDEFARKELGYDTVDSLHNALMGLQVDSVATSIHQIKQGKAVVIADQTGIGKGRQAASIIRWAALHGMTPVFVSVKPSLFTDMYGDLADIGTNDVTPFIMNSDAWVAGEGGAKLFANKPTGHKNVIQEIANSGQLPAGSNALFMTYSQINVANVQRQALMALAPNAVFVLDESHNAAGASSTGEFVIGTLEAAKGVVYLSATYAKRPDNMPLYFKTDIGDAAADTEGLAIAMASGGLPLQTVVSNNLVKAGQMFRRERSYDGVSIASVFDSPNRDLHERMSNEATKALRAIVSADRMFHEVYVKQLAEQLAATGATVQDSAGNQIEQGVQHTEFSSVVHNFVKQMLLGLKAQSAADEAIASLKRGEKPIIAVESTMGSFLNEYAAANGIGQGESLGTFDYRTVLTRALARSRVVIEVGTNGDKVKRPVPMDQLDAQTQAAYKDAQAVIDGLTLNIPVSPIDWMRAEIARAGFKVAEITGRNLSVDYGDPKKPMLSAIDAAEQKDKVNTTREFNSGKLDALILNVAGSTGISLHASEKFEDQRQRHMIVAQAAGDINIFMQMLGRVHRTGQVRLPKYTILSVDLPTEKRPTAVLSIKMKSLNANTSSNTESATSVKSSDILNKYGDQIVNQYLRDNYALARALDLADSIGDDPTEDIARKATGRLALQPIATQHVFYDEVEAQYTALIDYLNKTNQNDLEPRTFDFDAKEIRQEVLFEGPNKATPFGEDAIYGEYSIKAQGTPMKPEEIRATMAEHLGELSPAAYTQKRLDDLDAKFNAYYATLEDAGKDAASVVRNIGRDFLSGHKIGATFRVDINSEPFNAVVLNVRNTHKETGNPYSLSKIQVSVAVNGALRSLSVPATQFSKIEVSGIAPMFKIEQLFKEQPPNQRETAKIITGNLLAAYGEMQGVRGTIITFTKQDGTSEQGILLPKLFDYSKNTRGDYRLQDGAAALKFLQESDNKDIGRFGVMTRDGNVRVLPSGQGIRVQVPKSKLKGAKYFLDKGLVAAGGDFVTLGSFMVSNVTAPADAVKVLDLLMKKQALYALPSMADEAKALTGSKADPEDEANYGTKERGQGTPADRAVMAMAGDGKSADEILRFIANASKSPFNRQIAHLLRRTGANPVVSLGGDMGGGAGFRFLAKYSRKNHEVTLSQGAADRAEQIFLHETVHAATLLALDRGGEHADRMKALYESVKKQGLSDAYGMKNVGEFVAEAFSNKEFQNALKGYKASGGTAWDRFVAAVRRILGMSDRSQDALSAALELGVEVMRENMPLRKARSFSAEDAPAFSGVDQTATPDFKRWFGDSKAVDSAGKPLRVFHGTGKNITEFKDVEGRNGFYFADDPKYADLFAEGESPNILPVHLSIQKPADLRGEIPFEMQAALRKAGYGRVTDLRFANPSARWEFFDGDSSLRDALQAIGYDGARLIEPDPSGSEKTTSWVAFRPEQIKSATGNRGTFDPEDADIAHFGMADAASLKNSALDQIHQTLSHPGKVSVWDKTVGTMRNLAERSPAFKPVFDAAQRFIDDVSLLANETADVAPRLLPRVESWRDLTKKPVSAEDNKAISKPIFEGTLMWARDTDGKPVLVDDMAKKYADLSPEKRAKMLMAAGRLDDRVLRMWQGLPEEQFNAIINTRFESQMLKAGVVWTDAELKSLFNLSDQQISLYREARKAIDRSIDLTARADMLRAVGTGYSGMRDAVLEAPTLADARDMLVETLHADALDNEDQADRLTGMINTIADRFEKATELTAAGYAPLSRFGRYTVDVVDAAGERQYFGMAESMRDANQMAARMRSEFPGATVTQGTMSAEAYKLFAGITPESLELFGNMLGLDAEGGDARDKAFQEYLKLSKNNHSALKRLMHRKGIAGYSEDVGRVLASFVYSNARQAAGGLNAGTIEEAVNAIPKDQGELKDVAMGLRDYVRDPQEEGQAIRGMLFAQYLGGSVASAFVNMTQPVAVTLPWLSQFGGMKVAGQHLAKAFKDMAGKTAYEADLKTALDRAEEDGVVSPQEIHQLMAQARGAGGLRSGDGTRAGDARAAASNAWERTKVAWGQPFALAERFNRRSTFIAAYRMAKESGMQRPDQFARRAVLETQFLYSKANKPKWARGAIGGTLFTFKTYSVSYLELLNRMANAGAPGSPERAAGRRAVAWAMVTLMLMGGAGGLPFMEDLEDLIDGIAQLLGYNVSAKQWRKQAIEDVVGKEMGEFVNSGLSGLPGAPIDVSGRLGMGDLIPGTGLLMAKQNRERDLLEIVGPAGDLVSRGFTGARKVLTGDIGGAALEMSPGAVRNAAKGIDMATSGQYRDAKGYKVLDTTLPEAAAKLIGFQPRSVAKVQEANSFMMRSKAFYSQQSSEIKAQWARALYEKDEAALQDVRERLADWNSNNPDQPITVKMPDIWKRVREMGKDRTERIADTAPKALRQQMREMAS